VPLELLSCDETLAWAVDHVARSSLLSTSCIHLPDSITLRIFFPSALIHIVSYQPSCGVTVDVGKSSTKGHDPPHVAYVNLTVWYSGGRVELLYSNIEYSILSAGCPVTYSRNTREKQCPILEHRYHVLYCHHLYTMVRLIDALPASVCGLQLMLSNPFMSSRILGSHHRFAISLVCLGHGF